MAKKLTSMGLTTPTARTKDAEKAVSWGVSLLESEWDLIAELAADQGKKRGALAADMIRYVLRKIKTGEIKTTEETRKTKTLHL